MNSFDIKEKESEYEYIPKNLDKEESVNTLFDYLNHHNNPKLATPLSDTFINDLLLNYMKLKNTENGKLLEQCMINSRFNYSASIHNAIYYMLATEKEAKKYLTNNISPTDWPGVNSYSNKESTYTINTIYGNITVNKASEIFKNTKSNYIFQKRLSTMCYDRTYEFAKENPDYTIVLSYLPNFFSTGHFHAYLEKENQTLDIASNGLYETNDNSSKVLNGEIIKKMSLEEVEDDYKKITRELEYHPLIKQYSKLHLLSLYHKK